jgi:hypothetical protein
MTPSCDLRRATTPKGRRTEPRHGVARAICIVDGAICTTPGQSGERPGPPWPGSAVARRATAVGTPGADCRCVSIRPGVRRILAVGTAEDLREVLAGVLRVAGYVVETAREATDVRGFGSVPPPRPDLILVVPLEFEQASPRSAYHDPAWAGVPVIVVARRRRLGRRHVPGAVAVLAGPTAIDAWLAVIARHCDNHHHSSGVESPIVTRHVHEKNRRLQGSASRAEDVLGCPDGDATATPRPWGNGTSSSTRRSIEYGTSFTWIQ